jgi:broad-specificity NMP kinase
LSPHYVTARLLLKNNQPLPVDLAARLEAQGYDLSKIKET